MPDAPLHDNLFRQGRNTMSLLARENPGAGFFPGLWSRRD